MYVCSYVIFCVHVSPYCQTQKDHNERHLCITKHNRAANKFIPNNRPYFMLTLKLHFISNLSTTFQFIFQVFIPTTSAIQESLQYLNLIYCECNATNIKLVSHLPKVKMVMSHIHLFTFPIHTPIVNLQ